MNDSGTLNSRVRVLIAKTFRAEKLYGSMRTAPSGHIASSATISEMANDIRAKEWQRSHTQLRTSLNDVLSLSSGATIAKEVARLRDRFRAQSDEATIAVEETMQTLIETTKRHEFVHTLKLSLELIRNKAKAQANHVIAEELCAVLQASGRGELKAPEGKDPFAKSEEMQMDEEEKRFANASASNVIQFATGRRR